MTMTKEFVWRIVPSLAVVLALVGLLVTSQLANAQGLPSDNSYPILKIGSNVVSSPGHKFSPHLYVIPEDGVIKALAAQIDGVEDAYNVAVEWIYISEQKLNNVAEKWLTPHDFLVNTPRYPSNPLTGEAVSDCEEQAYTLVSLIRAEGIPPEEVRVVLGQVGPGDGAKGHVWVELLTNGHWLALDPTNGPYWDDKAGKLVRRQGVPFNYYANHTYPVPEVSAYYNDIYYLDLIDGSGNAPDSWRKFATEKNNNP